MSKRILIIDDNTAILESLQYILEDEGYKTKTHSNSNFINKINEYNTDLIILDYLLPGENGAEITKKLKSSKKTMNIPIIIISASYNIKNEVIQAGANEYISKPFDIEHLLSAIAKLLKK